MKAPRQTPSDWIVSQLLAGGIGVLATDTLYGAVGAALNPATVERIYRLKRRHPSKPFIILIGSLDDVSLFGVRLSPEQKQDLSQYWPGRVSVILPCPGEGLAYLHRGTHTLAFRLPAKPSLRRLIAKTGPLVAPSANPEGLTPARTIGQAKAYFGDGVDFYRRGHTVTSPSKLIQITSDGVTVLRP